MKENMIPNEKNLPSPTPGFLCMTVPSSLGGKVGMCRSAPISYCPDFWRKIFEFDRYLLDKYPQTIFEINNSLLDQIGIIPIHN